MNPECGRGDPQVYVQHNQLEVAVEAAGERLDRFLAATLPDLSRTQVQRLIQEGHVCPALGQATARYRVRSGERIDVGIPTTRPARPVAEDIPLHIVYEDDHLVVIDKPVGMVVHPAPGHARGTLVNALLYHCQTLSGIGGEERPGIIHRLDKDTSGLILVAKHDRSHRYLSDQLKARHVQRRYVAIVFGRMPAAHGTIDAPIGRHPRHRQKMAVLGRQGRAARTHYEVLETWGPLHVLRLTLETGRTHQIRVHLAHLGRPIVGDPMYGPGAIRLPHYPLIGQRVRSFPRPALHAEELRFQHPETAAWMAFTAPVPPDMADLLTHLRQAFDRSGGAGLI
jgi:23S rRNA pseudouridine1911/1915/1917 synthase